MNRSTNEQVEEWMSSELENPSTPHLASAKRNIIAKLQRNCSIINSLLKSKTKES